MREQLHIGKQVIIERVNQFMGKEVIQRCLVFLIKDFL